MNYKDCGITPARYAEVILPLPIADMFTYSIPPDMEGVERGSRVLVQFGPRKYYTAIVSDIVTTPPAGFQVKPIMALLDPTPIVRFPQVKMWRWIADYYLCTLGEVYKAAVPSGLKIESETFISVNPDFSPDESPLSEIQAEVFMEVSEEKRVRMSDLSRLLETPRLASTVNKLISMGALEVSERSIDTYRPRTEVCVGLCCNRDDNDKLHEFFGLTSRSVNQEKLLVAFLEMSCWLRTDEAVREVSKKELLERSRITAGIFDAMRKKGIFRTYKKSVNRFLAHATGKEPGVAELSLPQKNALSEIRDSFKSKGVTLLHGLTGSGKTEIYSHLIRDVLKEGNQVLYLVPEISLTTQLTDRLHKIFGNSLLVYHSKFSDSERVDIWRRVLSSSGPLLVLGVRSSVFLPFARLGLVIVDEEHEASYKQYDPAPRYNARDAAIVLASMHGAKTLLGSATPSVETYYKAQNGKYGLVTLSERYEGAALPDVEIVDMRAERKHKTANGIVSSRLRAVTSAALKEGKQAIMFQNRRGFAPIVQCRECGWTPKCVNCDVSLIYHKNISQIRCHYCGHSEALPNVCPACGQNSIVTYGYGTERIAEEMHEQFEGYRVARMDLDSTRSKDAFQEIIDEFANHETDILVGTQMVSKGLDFANVSVVGVLSADTLLNFPDFRSTERAFNMLEQVSGRAGRRDGNGHVVIQTNDPENEVLSFVSGHDYTGFYNHELQERHRYAYPPFTRVIMIKLRNKDARELDALAVTYTLELRKVFGNRVLGPEKPFVSRVSTWYIQQIMLKVESGASMSKVKKLLRDIFVQMASDSRMKRTQVFYDVDPV